MAIVEQAGVAPGARINVWIACGLGVVGIVLPILPNTSASDWIAPVSLVLPLAAFALMLATPEAFGITKAGRRTLNVLPGLSVFGLVISANVNTSFLDLRLALLPTALCAALALLLGVGLAGRRFPGSFWVSILFLAVFGGAYGYGGLTFADTRFDHAQAQVFSATVERQYLSHSRSSTTPHLVLGPWGPVSGESNVTVSRVAYDKLTPGQTACVTLHPGRLSVPWFRADVCGSGF